jgi:CheY-like chemotaxis protein
MSTILLVEDDFSIRQMYTTLFEQRGFTVITADTGTAGLEEAKKQPDIILLDVELPELTGIGVLKQLKTDKGLKHIPVVMLTNLSDDTVMREAIEYGAESYFLKSEGEPQDIVTMVHGILNEHKKKKKT